MCSENYFNNKMKEKNVNKFVHNFTEVALTKSKIDLIEKGINHRHPRPLPNIWTVNINIKNIKTLLFSGPITCIITTTTQQHKKRMKIIRKHILDSTYNFAHVKGSTKEATITHNEH